MKKTVTLICFALLSFASFGQSGAKIEFKAINNTIDYGKIYKGVDNGIRVFEFTNTGDAPLVILDVQSTCGCTVPTKPKEPILPGQTGQIEVKYNMATGPIRKSLTVESNAINYERGKIHLKIKGEVLEKADTKVLEKKKAG